VADRWSFDGGLRVACWRIRLLLALVAALVLVVAALAVDSTMVTAVLERRAEIGLMKALGPPSDRWSPSFWSRG
jgi:ABC-type lipoprotein release transport system permease subunit